MTMPAEITSGTDWDRLVVLLRAQYHDIDDLYQRITDPDLDDEGGPGEDSELMPDPDLYPYPGYDPEGDALDAELEHERRIEEDVASDGRLDGDHYLDPRDEPSVDMS